jgi:uncharacterized protein YuzE
MAHLYINSETDSIYLDLTVEGSSPVKMAEPADGIYLHLDEAGIVVAVEIMDMGQRGSPEPGVMGNLHVNPITDSLYLDVSAGARPPARMITVAEGVFLYIDRANSPVGVEVTDLRKRGGLQVDDLDTTAGDSRPAIFDEIERIMQTPEDPQSMA